jgi:uncharacterized ferritin-like protein (DUF455 family)
LTDKDVCLTKSARDVLLTADPVEKAAAARALHTEWRAGALAVIGIDDMPDRPARPARPQLLPPREMPRRRKTSGTANRVALLHAIAHIELNAIDLSIDIAGRFGPSYGATFVSDWLSVADDEARHFLMLQGRLFALDAGYGDLPAHDGLWEAAQATSGDICARLAVAHTVLEARGLDVTPAMIERLTRFGDTESAAVLTTILSEEIRHVRLGVEWFGRIARQRGMDEEPYWQELVRTYFRGSLKRPFNTSARRMAGLLPTYYEPLAD